MSETNQTPISDDSDDLESKNSPLDKDGSSERNSKHRNQDHSGGRDEDVKAPVEPGDLVDGRFKVQQILGQGGFGAVFEVLDYKSKRPAAMKIELEEPDSDEPGLTLEACVLRRMKNNRHFPRFLHSGRHKNLTYVVMQLLGDSLICLRKRCPDRRFTLPTTLQVALQSLEAVRCLHKSDLLHRDIKPENFVVGFYAVDRRTIFMLDFGLVRRFRIGGNLRPARKTAPFRGTYQYASPRVLSNLDACRADDLCSWLYVTVELANGGLPWSGENRRQQLIEIKSTEFEAKTLARLPQEFRATYALISNVRFEEDPPYGAIRTLFVSLMQKQGISERHPYDWEVGGAFHAQVFSKIETKRQMLRQQMDKVA